VHNLILLMYYYSYVCCVVERGILVCYNCKTFPLFAGGGHKISILKSSSGSELANSKLDQFVFRTGSPVLANLQILKSI
jgi:hypothetical protein